MGHGHFRQAAHQQQGDDCANGIAQQHARPGITNGIGAAHEQPGADCTPNGDHAHLPRRQLTPQAMFTVGYRFETAVIGHFYVLWILSFLKSTSWV
ncbi:hypothetical protein D3C72_1976610 [compost metagenome]